jgi:hypothetical protein
MHDFLYNQHMANLNIGRQNMRQQAADLASEKLATALSPLPGFPSPEFIARSHISNTFDPLYPDPALHFPSALCFSASMRSEYLSVLSEDEDSLRICGERFIKRYLDGKIDGRQLEERMKKLRKGRLMYSFIDDLIDKTR